VKADPEQAPSPAGRFDPGVAHAARVYSYWLGGKDHYPADRADRGLPAERSLLYG
jgi:hypothetical protein